MHFKNLVRTYVEIDNKLKTLEEKAAIKKRFNFYLHSSSKFYVFSCVLARTELDSVSQHSNLICLYHPRKCSLCEL